MKIRHKHVNSVSSGLIVGANGSCELWTVNINNGASGAVLTIYDGISTAGDVVAMIDASSKSSHSYLAYCNKGLFFDLATANADVTICYS